MNETEVENSAEDNLLPTKPTALDRAEIDVNPGHGGEGKKRRQTMYNDKEKDQDWINTY